MSFDVEIGHHSERGARERNEDFAGAMQAPPHEAQRGWVAAVADGVSSGGLGREAAQSTVMGLLSDFHAAPPTWETTVVFERLIGAQNAWLADHNRRRSGVGAEHRAGLTTLTALALQSHTWTLAHVGDTRAWLLRGDELMQLSDDHALDHPDLRSQLTRAIGLDRSVHVDYLQGELHTGDCFLLTSDGVHNQLGRDRIAALLTQGTAQQASQALVQAALEAGTRDNATALVLRVHGLAPQRLSDGVAAARRLPVPPKLKIGDELDGHVITALVADTGVHRLYQARAVKDGALVAIKTLHESRASDFEERAMLAHEAWLGLRVTEREGQGFVRVRDAVDATFFYTVYDWHSGQTLEQRMARGAPLGVAEAVQAGIAAAKALGRLHRHGVVHRDVKPGNLHLGDDGQWRVLDLGVAVSGQEPAAVRQLHAGTPSYMNPEQWAEGGQADAASDLFALGVTLYQALTGKLPYGEIEPYQTARYRRDPQAPSRLRPEVPIWLDHVLLKAVARDPKHRFETAEELVLALERGASRPLDAIARTPLIRRDPTALWKAALAVSIGFNVLLIVWLLFLPR
jgi:serine/threonine protein phosphatase PrpC